MVGTLLAICLGNELKGINNMITDENQKRMTITEVAQIVGISAKTIMRWEKLGKIKKPKRNWRSWRVYDENDLIQIRQLHEILIEVE
jgi:hypothetical protein